MVPESAPAHAGLIRSLIAMGQVEEAENILADLPEGIDKDPVIERARAALALAKDKPEDGELAALRAAHEADPAQPEAALAYANGAFAAGQRDAAADTLLAMIAADRGWNEGAARAKLLQIFEAIGLEDPGFGHAPPPLHGSVRLIRQGRWRDSPSFLWPGRSSTPA
jgi:putative thioredoxin